MIVADVNVLVYLWLPGPFSAAAALCLKKDPVWLVPLVWRYEFRNVLATYMRNGLLDYNAAKAVYEKAEKTVNGMEYSIPAVEVLDAAFYSKCSAYDCEYIVLAQRQSVKVVTKDAKLIKAFPKFTIDLEAFVKP